MTYSWESIDQIDESDEEVDVGGGWAIRRWAIAKFTAPARSGLPTFVVKVEAEQIGHGLRIGVTEITATGTGHQLRPSELRALAEALPNITVPALLYGSSASWSSTRISPSRSEMTATRQESRESLVKALRAAGRVSARTQFEREDEALQRWESEQLANPRSRQRDVATDMGLEYGTFRTYLAHARARRNRK